MQSQENRLVTELSIVFAISQDKFGISNGCLDENFAHYGVWVDEIHSAIQNGTNSLQNISNYSKSKFTGSLEPDRDASGRIINNTASSIEFRKFMF